MCRTTCRASINCGQAKVGLFAAFAVAAVNQHALYQGWVKLVASSGLPTRTLHEGRHTAVTIGRVHAGVDAATMRERVGHACEHVAERYTHPHAAVSKAAAQAIANIIDSPGTDRPEDTGTG
ncbi:MAG: site-specific integrase [Dermatophilaceae bacterium]